MRDGAAAGWRMGASRSHSEPRECLAREVRVWGGVPMGGSSLLGDGRRGERPLRGLGVYGLQTFLDRYFAEYFVGNDEVLDQIQRGEIDCNRELERVKSTQAMEKGILSDQALGGQKVAGSKVVHFDIARSHVEH